MLTYWRLADTESGHASMLLELLALPQDARVADLGCGTGELARLCHELRPDLHWSLVNANDWQLEQCPPWAECIKADMTCTGLQDGAYDAVVIAYALGYVNPVAALEEASRLLKVGGKLVLHELYSDMGDVQALAKRELGYKLAGFGEVAMWANLIGLELGVLIADDYRAAGQTVKQAGHVFEQFEHNLCLFTKQERPHVFMGRRVALHFSGGKDSLACLLLLRPFVEKGLPVYWTSTGDTIPETLAVVEWAKSWVPDFREVHADVVAWKAVHGMPSDATTAQSSWIGQQYGMGTARLVGRFDCCWSNLMMPMHERMVADGVELVIRGTKLADTGKVPAHGQTEHYEVLLPLMDWSHAEVFEYLQRAGAPVNPVYEHFSAISAPECLGCTAWWEDGKAGYLKARHPQRVHEYATSLQDIRSELVRRVNELDNELKECMQ